jgi:VIT1/CCC1 family predicted Fe2+/Mn2+ transporter
MKVKVREDSSTLYPLVVVAMLLLGLVGVVQPQLIMPPIPATLSVLFEGVGVGLVGAGVGYLVLRLVRPTREQFHS